MKRNLKPLAIILSLISLMSMLYSFAPAQATVNDVSKASNQVKITFNTLSDAKVSPIKVTSGSLVKKPVDPVRPHYIFAGWFKEKECKNVWDFTKDTLTQDTIVYAKWEVRYWTVSFELGKPDTTDKAPVITKELTPKQVRSAKGISYFDAPGAVVLEMSDLGYGYTGLFKDEACTKKWDYNVDTVTADTTLYMGWIKVLSTAGSYQTVSETPPTASP